jgi:UDP-N-acetylglucosamine--N-acetylmuramyl-(pentapeptide) pyrophosphoryl-undecaprenol N-acetylglucosamine transferase
MARSRPDVVLVTGGYVCVPVALAARLRAVPVVVFLPDVVPGRAVRLIAALSSRVATSSERSFRFLPAGKAVETGYPVRAAVRAADRLSARRRFGIGADSPLLLVFGGSRGARRINEALLATAPRLLEQMAIIHVAGRLDFDAVARASGAFAPALAERYRVFPFLDAEDMSLALAAADLAVSRAGAAVMGEYPARGLPAILVPLAIAAGHQSANAAVLVEAGAATVIDDADLTGSALAGSVTALLRDPARLAAMSAASRRIDKPEAARSIWRIMVESARMAPAGSAA